MKKEKESELEEEIEQEEDVEEKTEEEIEEDFVEFMQPSFRTNSPSLGQIEIAPEFRATDLERDLSETSVENNKKEDKEEFKYSSGINQEENPKYVSSENIEERNIIQGPSHIEIENLGRQQEFFQHKEIGFTNSPSAGIGDSGDLEKYTLPERFDVESAGKKDFFKKEDIKYKPSR